MFCYGLHKDCSRNLWQKVKNFLKSYFFPIMIEMFPLLSEYL